MKGMSAVRKRLTRRYLAAHFEVVINDKLDRPSAGHAAHCAI